MRQDVQALRRYPSGPWGSRYISTPPRLVNLPEARATLNDKTAIAFKRCRNVEYLLILSSLSPMFTEDTRIRLGISHVLDPLCMLGDTK